jgi:hypothetical protein
MPRRLLALLALVATVAVLACNSTPAAPALTDPKEILVKSIESLANIKTATIKGTFGGSVNAAEMGNFDLSTVKIDLALDVPAKKTRITVDAPTLMGTNVDLIVADGNVYMKVVGPMAAFLGADASGKYTKTAADTGSVPDEASDPTKAIAELRAGLDKLPKAPSKLADERCGDQDCYHVQIALTGADLATLGGGSDIGNVSFDVWTRKNDLRPAKITFAVDAGTQGNVTGTFDITYDQGVNISAPSADQVAPG